MALTRRSQAAAGQSLQMTRLAISTSRLVAIPHKAEAIVKTAIDSEEIIRRPSRVPNQPEIGRTMALAAR